MHVLELKPPSSGQLAVGAHFPAVISIALMVLVYHGSRSERFARPRLVMSPLFSNFVVKWREQVPDQKHLQGPRSETFARPRQKHLQGHAGNIHLSEHICKATLETSTWAIGSKSERFARPRLVMSPLFSNFVVKWREQVPDQKHLQGHARNMCKATLGTSTWAIALLEGASFCARTIYM